MQGPERAGGLLSLITDYFHEKNKKFLQAVSNQFCLIAHPAAECLIVKFRRCDLQLLPPSSPCLNLNYASCVIIDPREPARQHTCV